MTDLRRKRKRRCGGSDKLIRAVICLLFIAYAVIICVLFTLAAQVEDYQRQARAQADAEQAEISEQLAQCKDTPALTNESRESAEVVQSTPSIINDGYVQTLTKSMGVYNYNGKRETYYSSKVLRHKDIGQWWCDSNGFWRTSEGYFVVSSVDYSYGTVVNISMGQAKVLDSGCAHGVFDIYTE